MSWVKKNVHPGKVVSTSQEVDVMVLEVDENKRRVSLGLKQCLDNPWDNFAEKHPLGSIVEGEIKNITEFGLFVGITEEMDGMVHLSDLDWNRPGEEVIKEYKKGDVVKAKVLDVDPEKERISLGIKQVGSDPMDSVGEINRGDDVTCTVTAIESGGIEVQVGGEGGPKAFIKKSDLSKDRGEQRPERFAVGDKVDARVTGFDKISRRISLSIKAREVAEEKEAVEQYGSADSGASLGDILGAALKNRDKQ
jgi:small subunit ribosomal protein S1